MFVPFASEAYKRVSAATPEARLVNFIVEKDDSKSEDRREEVMLLQRPGLSPFTTLPGSIQGIYSPDNPAMPDAYAVAGNKLYALDGNTSTQLGDIGGTTGIVQMVANFDRLVIVCYPLVYVYGATKDSTTPSFRNLPIPDLFGSGAPHAIGVTMINSYFVIACEDGTFMWLVPGEDELNPLNYATAESSPDGLRGVTTLNGNLMFLGSNTVETWQPTGNALLPFQRAVGQDYAHGCAATNSIVNFDNAVIWVGEDGKVYRASDVPQRISTDGIDERLKLRTGDPHAWAFARDGHLFYVLTIPGQGTFAFDAASKLWSQFTSNAREYWLPIVGCLSSDGYLCGGEETGDIWLVSDAPTDAGQPIDRRVTATANVPSKPERVDNIVIDMGCSAVCEMTMRWADADEQLGAQEWITLPVPRAGTNDISYYRMGAARAPYRTFELRITDPVVVRLSGVRVGEAFR